MVLTFVQQKKFEVSLPQSSTKTQMLSGESCLRPLFASLCDLQLATSHTTSIWLRRSYIRLGAAPSGDPTPLKFFRQATDFHGRIRAVAALQLFLLW